MKLSLILIALTAVSGLSAGDASLPAVYKSSSDLMAKLKENMAAAKNGQSDSPIDNEDHYRINIVHRTAPGQAMAHATGPAKGSEVHYIIDGTATVVTGGTLNRPATQGAASSIENGVTQHVAKGDVIVIPAGTPHWYKEIGSGGVTYLEMRFDVELTKK